MEVIIIAAVSDNGVIGIKDDFSELGRIPWDIPEDLKRFRQLTMGHAVVMGRMTYQSLPKSPLSGRLNIVLTQAQRLPTDQYESVTTVREALYLGHSRHIRKLFICGGYQVYKEFLPTADRMEITRVHTNVYNTGLSEDRVFFPLDFSMRMEGWQRASLESHENYDFEAYERV